MADVFISYAREDRPTAERFARVLEEKGWSVWWDRQILHGNDFQAVIQRELQAARCVVVLWSEASIESDFVRDEATEGKKTRTRASRLVPILIAEDVTPPLGFRGLQNAALNNWDGTDSGEEIERLFASIRAIAPLPPDAGERDAGTFMPNAAEPVAVASTATVPLPLVDPGELYRAGIRAQLEGDLSRTAALWQQVIDLAPQFQQGMLAKQLETVQRQLLPVQKQQLREQARNAQHAGAWAEEVSAWRSLLRVEADDKEAQDRIPIAEENQKYAWIYDNARQFTMEGALAAAQSQLEMLRQERPEYGDPAGLAQQAGFVGIRLRSASGRYDYQTPNGRARHKDIRIDIVSQDLDGSLTAYIELHFSGPRYSCRGTVNNDGHIVLRGKHEQAPQEIILEGKFEILEGKTEPGGRCEGRIVIATAEATIQTGTWRIDSLLAPQAPRPTIL